MLGSSIMSQPSPPSLLHKKKALVPGDVFSLLLIVIKQKMRLLRRRNLFGMIQQTADHGTPGRLTNPYWASIYDAPWPE